ncbi:hypothetical protein [Desulforegula conservatrix]|uniref:hypothetical protein n=1 Tax=Desulforegula conservatrix TaxID=153026 RepID=UPI00047F9F99|nr:hypothetical protein [Desulforegula conservatrix]
MDSTPDPNESYKFNKESLIDLYAQAHILLALLTVIPQKDLQRLKDHLELQVATCGQEGLLGESRLLALQLVSGSHRKEDNPEESRKLFRVIQNNDKPQ